MEKNSHCGYCGTKFPKGLAWPRHCLSCGNTSYLNPLPVVVVLVPIAEGLLVIRRNNEPQKGTLALPGGYLGVGESWQQGARRELYEETGIETIEEQISLYDVRNGLDDTIVIFGLTGKLPIKAVRPFSSEETQEVSLIKAPATLGFPLHTDIVERYFNNKRRNLEIAR